MKQSDIIRLLPEIFQRTLPDEEVPGKADGANLLDALLAVMENQHAPAETVLKNLDLYFDPYRTPDRFVPFLATWVDLTALVHEVPEMFADSVPPLPSGTGRLRELIALAAYLAQWRGTYAGLVRFLETATGVSGFAIDEQVLDERAGRARPYHIRILAPAETEQYQVMLQKIIEMEKPAYVTYELAFT